MLAANPIQLCCITLAVFLVIFTDDVSAAAGRCYQCNSRNALCGMDVNPVLKRDSTPCNGQCYTRVNNDDAGTISRGCSWEHGFMTVQAANTPIPKGNSVFIFCDTAFCNYEATGLLNSVCYQPICDFFSFPSECTLPGVGAICGRFCGNKLCGGK